MLPAIHTRIHHTSRSTRDNGLCTLHIIKTQQLTQTYCGTALTTKGGTTLVLAARNPTGCAQYLARPREHVPLHRHGTEALVASGNLPPFQCSSKVSSATPLPPACLQVGKTAMFQAEVKDKCVVCPAHGTYFDLKTGEVKGEWCPKVGCAPGRGHHAGTSLDHQP